MHGRLLRKQRPFPTFGCAIHRKQKKLEILISSCPNYTFTHRHYSCRRPIKLSSKNHPRERRCAPRRLRDTQCSSVFDFRIPPPSLLEADDASSRLGIASFARGQRRRLFRPALRCLARRSHPRVGNGRDVTSERRFRPAQLNLSDSRHAACSKDGERTRTSDLWLKSSGM